jgi:hypothetical protein
MPLPLATAFRICLHLRSATALPRFECVFAHSMIPRRHHSTVGNGHLVMSHAFEVWLNLSGGGLGLESIPTRAFCFMRLNDLLLSSAVMLARHRSIPKKYWTCARDGVRLSLTAAGMSVNIPFGAAHRVNIDTPPLQGNCRDTLVSR